MLLTSMKTALLILLVVQAWGAINLATNKPAVQNSEYLDSSGDGYPARLAIDGDTSTFSHTESGSDVNWWMIDLGAKYTVGTIKIFKRFGYNLTRVSVLTSNATIPAIPSLTSNDWTKVAYEDAPYSDVHTDYFNPPIHGQHVALLNDQVGGLALAEVEVYDYNYALYKPTDSSTNKGNSHRATDGDLSVTFATNYEQKPWWKVDLGQKMLLREVLIFFNEEEHPQNVYFLTNPSNLPNEPNTEGNDQWSKCYYSQEALGYQHTVKCNQGYLHPLTRLFSIICNVETHIQLRQVEVYGYELPQLSGDIDARVDSILSTSATISFQPWNQLMIGGSPPTGYAIEVIGGETKSVVHNSNSGRLTMTIDGLDAGKKQNFTVSCTIQNTACIGLTHHLNASTLCAVPSAPGTITLSSAKVQHSDRQRWKYTATWMGPSKANCDDTIQYQYSFAGESLQTTSALQTTATATFYLDGDIPFELVVKAKNSVGFSIPKSKSGTSGVLIPQFGSDRLSVTASNSTCVTFTWYLPLYPGGTITRYQFKCGGGNYVGIAAGSRTQSSCTHLPNTEVNCWVRAKNKAGWGYTQALTKTPCDVPTPPQSISITSSKSQNSGRNKWLLSANWQAPDRTNCNDSVQYRYGIQTAPTSSLLSAMTAAFYLDGDQPYVFTVQAKNSIGFSTSSSESGRSDPLAPQFGTSQISLTATSSECVKLSWTEPEYPGGNITQYQYRCNEDTFTDVGLQTTNKDSCGYEPFTNVSCRFRAGNIAGFSNVQTKAAITNCAAPVFTKTPTYTDEYDSEKKRRKVMVDVQEVNRHCATLNPLEYKVLNEEFSTDNTIRQLEAITRYNITVKATNNQGLSTSVYIIAMTGELEPWDGPQITDRYSENKTCAVVEWKEPLQPNGVITEYQHQCIMKNRSYGSQWTTTTTTRLSDCVYKTGNDVKCRVKAATAIGYGPAVQVTLNIPCDNPTAPVFTLYSYEGSNGSAIIEVHLQESTPRCNFLKPYTITFKPQEGEVFNTTFETAGNHTIENAAPFTNYTVTVEATNDADLKSITMESIFTAETAPSDGPRLDVTFTESCVLLSVQPPEHPNGVLIIYQYWCTEADEKFKGNVPLSVEEVNSGVVSEVCDFPQATEIVCDVYAVNKVGESPTSSIFGYTKAIITANGSPTMLPPAETKSLLAVLKILPVELQDPRLVISSYLVLLRNETSTEVKRSIEEKCDIDKENCITIAEIDSELVTADGYWFHIGDGKSYGGYVNSPLAPKSAYYVQVVLSVQLPEAAGMFYQALTGAISFAAPSYQCEPPPDIANAVPSSTADEDVGTKVLYACEGGYQKTGGDLQLTCTLTEEYTNEWLGSHLVCTRSLWLALGVGFGVLAVVAGIAGVIACVKMRKTHAANQPPIERNELEDYEELNRRATSGYEQLQLDLSKPPDETNPENVKAGDNVYEFAP